MISARVTPHASFTAAPCTRRRVIAGGIARATPAAGALAACGQQTAGGARPIAPTVQGALRWSSWASGASLERSQQEPRVFTALYPNVTVEALSIPTKYARPGNSGRPRRTGRP